MSAVTHHPMRPRRPNPAEDNLSIDAFRSELSLRDLTRDLFSDVRDAVTKSGLSHKAQQEKLALFGEGIFNGIAAIYVALPGASPS